MAKRVNYEDLIIDLYIFNMMDRQSANMSTAKLLYIFEDRLYKKNMIGAHYQMIRHKWGPYNNKIGTNLKNLALNGYLYYKENFFDKADRDVKIFVKNIKTRKFLKSIDDLIQEYSKIFEILDDVISEFGDMNADNLKDYIYSLERTGLLKKRIVDYKMYTIILDPDKLPYPKVNFYLNDDWYDTVEVLLNVDVLNKLQTAITNVQHGKFTLL